MMVKKEQHIRCTGRTVSDRYRRVVKSRMPQMASLLDKLDAQETPNFLDVMAGLSEMVAFYTECDQDSVDPPEINILMSGKKCRFCC